MDDKEKMIDDIVAMLDNSVKKGDGHINVVIDENQKDSKEVTRGCADCSVPTIELPGDEDFER